MTTTLPHQLAITDTGATITLSIGEVHSALDREDANAIAHALLKNVVAAASAGHTDVYLSISGRDTVLDLPVAIHVAEQLIALTENR